MTLYCESCQKRKGTHRFGGDDEWNPIQQLCDECFANQFERSISNSIAWWGMLDSNSRIMVGVSGIDSVALVCCLIALGFSQRMLCCIIREQEGTHRDDEIRIWQNFSRRFNIPLIEKNFQNEYGESLKEIFERKSEVFTGNFAPCVVCALLRNRLLYQTALKEECSVLALGGHADDAASNRLGAYLFGETIQVGPIIYKRAFPACQQIGLLKVIRPMALEEKNTVEEYARVKENITMPNYKCNYQGFRGSFKMLKVVETINKAFPGARRILAQQAILAAPSYLPSCSVCGAFRDELETGRCAACSIMDYLGINGGKNR